MAPTVSSLALVLRGQSNGPSRILPSRARRERTSNVGEELSIWLTERPQTM